MSKIVFCALIFLFLRVQPAYGAPSPIKAFEGTFHPTPKFTPLSQIENWVVDNRRPGSADQLHQLQENKFTCQMVTSAFYLCRKFAPLTQVSSELQRRAMAHLDPKSQLTFLEITERFGHQVNDSDLLKEWDYKNAVLLNGINFKQYRISTGPKAPWKFSLYGQDGQLFTGFTIYSSTVLLMYLPLRIAENDQHWTEYNLYNIWTNTSQFHPN